MVPPVIPSFVAIDVTVPSPVPAPISERSCAGVLVASVLVVDVGSAVNTGICVADEAVDEALEFIDPFIVIPAKVGVADVCIFCGKLKVGFPDTPLPLVTVTWFDVPVIVRPATVPVPVLAISPLVDKLCSARAWPVRPIVPVLVIVPPVTPLFVAIEVTVPTPKELIEEFFQTSSELS
jgi:hypothetical protein